MGKFSYRLQMIDNYLCACVCMCVRGWSIKNERNLQIWYGQNQPVMVLSEGAILPDIRKGL